MLNGGANAGYRGASQAGSGRLHDQRHDVHRCRAGPRLGRRHGRNDPVERRRQRRRAGHPRLRSDPSGQSPGTRSYSDPGPTHRARGRELHLARARERRRPAGARTGRADATVAAGGQRRPRAEPGAHRLTADLQSGGRCIADGARRSAGFVLPRAKTAPQLAWSAHADRHVLTLTLSNSGTAHVQALETRLYRDHGTLVAEQQLAAYVLAGQTRAGSIKTAQPWRGEEAEARRQDERPRGPRKSRRSKRAESVASRLKARVASLLTCERCSEDLRDHGEAASSVRRPRYMARGRTRTPNRRCRAGLRSRPCSALHPTCRTIAVTRCS
jgi:hypothetical protein